VHVVLVDDMAKQRGGEQGAGRMGAVGLVVGELVDPRGAALDRPELGGDGLSFDLCDPHAQRACRRFGLSDDREICSFLANIGVESGGLTRLSESLNYSVQGLLGTFGRHRISEADARRLGRKSGERSLPLARQEELANLLYGGDWGRTNLGNTEPGDGWRFRGYGPKQLTGRGNCSRFADAVQLPLAQIPDFLRTPHGGCLGAGWLWQAHGLDRYAATPGLGDDRRAINGGELGLAEVEQRFDRLMAEMARRRASAPASAPAAP